MDNMVVMTPVEAGVLGGTAVLFVAVLAGVTTRAIWWTAWLVTLAAGVLTWEPTTLFVVEWPGRYSGGSTGADHLTAYFGGHLNGGPAAADLKCLALLLWAVAITAFISHYHGGESLLIGTTAVVAGLLSMSTDNLVVLYLSLELQALSLYTLVGLYRFNEERTEAALRYLLTGSLVSGFMLLGFAYGYTENATFYVHESVDHPGAVWVAGVLLFKLGAAPFHFWTPVVYTPLEWGTLGLVLGTGKVNLWYLLSVTLAEYVTIAWWPLWWAGLVSLLVGAVGGYFQTSVAGLLAYSGVVNAGYLLLLWCGGDYFSFGYYTVVYLWSTVALVAVTCVWPTTQLTGLTYWTKLGVLTPLLLYYLTLNLGGLPVFPGFFSKLLLLHGILPFGWLTTIVVVVASLVPAVYYVRVAGSALFQTKEVSLQLPTWLPHPTVGLVTVVFAAAATATTAVV